MKIKSYQDLIVWQKSMDLVEAIYKTTEKLPAKELYGLSSQIRRSSVSIPSNIAEGSKRSSRADFRQFCLIAHGSSAEVETQLLIIGRLYPKIPINHAILLTIEVQKMLSALSIRLKTTN